MRHWSMVYPRYITDWKEVVGMSAKETSGQNVRRKVKAVCYFD